MSKEMGCTKYMEVSSKTGEGLLEIFNSAVALVLEQRGTPSGGSDLRGSSSSNKKKKSGCALL